MNIDHLKSFLAISKYKSLSRAAQSLFITQPTLSSRITKLENFLDMNLFERSWKGVELTEEGVLFLPRALKMLDNLENFTSLCTNFVDHNNNPYIGSVEKINNTFKIGMNHYLVNTYAELFIQVLSDKFPDLQFNITTAPTRELIKEIYYGALDYILYYDFNARFATTKMIKYEEMVVILNKEDYVQVKHNVQNLGILGKPLYLNSNPVIEAYRSYFQRFLEYVQVDDVIVVDNVSLIKILIHANKGYSILPDTVYEASFKNDGLYKLPVPNELTRLPIFSAYNDENERFLPCSLFLNDCLLNQNVSHSLP